MQNFNLMNTVLAHTAENGETDLFSMHHGFGMMGGFGWSGIFFGWIFMLLFLTLVILVIVALVKYIKN